MNWFSRRIHKDKSGTAVAKLEQDLVETIVMGKVKVRATSEGKMYEGFYSLAPTNVMVCRRMARLAYPMWLKLHNENVLSGKWKEDPKANVVIPVDDSDLSPFQADAENGPFFDSPLELFDSVDLVPHPNSKREPWWAKYTTAQVFLMQVRHRSIQSDPSLNFFPAENTMHAEHAPLGARQG